MPNPITQHRLHFEDLTLGEIIPLGEITITKPMIFEFAREFDPLPFHLDEAYAKRSLLGGLAASGWQTAGLALRMLVEAFLNRIDSQGGLGFHDLKWKKPVMAGDTISATAKVSGLRRSRSNPQWAILEIDFTVTNQRHQPVMTMRLANLVGVRDPAQPVAVAP